MEEHACVADCGADGKVTLWTSTQTPHYVHREVAKVLGIPQSHLRVLVPAVGGGFGGKCEPFAHDFAACPFALGPGPPVEITPPPEEGFLCHPRGHPLKRLLKNAGQRAGPITTRHPRTVAA